MSDSLARKLFRLDAAETTYAFGIDDSGRLLHVHFGARLAPDDPLSLPPTPKGWVSFDPVPAVQAQEFPGWGSAYYNEPALKLKFADGNRDVVLVVRKCVERGHRIEVTLSDVSRAIELRLYYEIDPQSGIVSRSALITNTGMEPVVVDQIASASFTLPEAQAWSLRHLTGHWGGEWQLQTRPLLQGTQVLESRRGSTGHEANPWFAVTADPDWHEDRGRVWFGALAWSGSWRITVEHDVLRRVRVSGGFNPFDFCYRLLPGESLETPTFHAGYTDHGIGEASRLLHGFQLSRVLPQAPMPRVRPVLYNSWEATQFDVTVQGQMRLAELAARAGVERFVVDDGWFGQRDDDQAGLGDWFVNRDKFPRGLKPLIDHVKGLGMDFGLWVEPEMVNRDSDLYRAHPEWVLHFPGRQRTEARAQMVLNLARHDVAEHLFVMLSRLLSENDIAFLKWDYNRNWSEPGWPEQAPEDQQKLHVAYTRNLYALLSQLRDAHPQVEIESCSGGGGRVDLGILAHTDQVWTSDNTDPYDRVAIQQGFSHAYAPLVMMSWVTASPNWLNGRESSLAYRFASAMQGSLGIGDDLTRWTDADLAIAGRLVDAYKDIRETVQLGRVYRLTPGAGQDNLTASQSLAQDGSQAVMFVYLRSAVRAEPPLPVRWRGLEPDARYLLRVIEGSLAEGTPKLASGAWWMSQGLRWNLRGDFQAAIAVLDRAGD